MPAVIVTGPRQSGKSTLCQATFPEHVHVSLESPDRRQYATEDPRGFLASLGRGAILDEIQNCPDLTSYLQEMIDRDPRPGRWILTGSQNFLMLASARQSLAGRAAILHLVPLARGEVVRFPRHPQTLNETLLCGGYPRIFNDQLDPSEWLAAYAATYLERDVRTMLKVGDLTLFQRFVQLCAGRAGQLLNLSALAGDSGVSQPTARAWLSVLEASFLVFRLPAWHATIAKRLIKMPKLQFWDSGLTCWLLGIRDSAQLDLHPLRGLIFESWVVAEVAKARLNQGRTEPIYHFRDKGGVECDALLTTGRTVTLVEAKAGQTISSDMADPLRRIGTLLGRHGLTPVLVVVYGGQERQQRGDVLYLPWHEIHTFPWAG
jgi:predicted AAA+ superfamily ATPase